MSEPVKAGDLAVIVRSETFPESVGWYVIVAGPGSHQGHVWIEHSTPLGEARLTRTQIPPEWLKRIPPLEELEGKKETADLGEAMRKLKRELLEMGK